MSINNFSYQKNICLREMLSIIDISDFHEKILGPPLYKKYYYILYPWGCQFQAVLWKKNTEENAKKCFSLLACSKNSLDQTNSTYLCVFLSSALLVPPKPQPCSLCHLKKDLYDCLIQYKTLQVVLNNLFDFMNLLQFSSPISQKKRNSSPSVTQSFCDLNFSENDKNISLIPTLAYMGKVLS